MSPVSDKSMLFHHHEVWCDATCFLYFSCPVCANPLYDRAYLACDEACCKHLVAQQNIFGTEDISGATALSALLIQGDETFPKALYVANCGDTRGVLCEEIFEHPGMYEARRLTYDHKAEDSEEKIRIKKLGGSVKNGRWKWWHLYIFISSHIISYTIY